MIGIVATRYTLVVLATNVVPLFKTNILNRFDQRRPLLRMDNRILVNFEQIFTEGVDTDTHHYVGWLEVEVVT